MMLSVVPMYASAAEPEVLTKSNITQYPTISFKNADGKFYAGQMVGDGLIINDDEIVTDASGNQVAGHFEFIDLTYILYICLLDRYFLQFPVFFFAYCLNLL